MTDAFDRYGFYFEDSEFELDLNLQDKRRELIYLLENDKPLVPDPRELKELTNIPTPNFEENFTYDGPVLVLHTGEVDPEDTQVIPSFSQGLMVDIPPPPPPSALPIPKWAVPDLVGSWLQHSIEEFTLKYYSESVKEFFKHFDEKDKNKTGF